MDKIGRAKGILRGHESLPRLSRACLHGNAAADDGDTVKGSTAIWDSNIIHPAAISYLAIEMKSRRVGIFSRISVYARVSLPVSQH